VDKTEHFLETAMEKNFANPLWKSSIGKPLKNELRLFKITCNLVSYQQRFPVTLQTISVTYIHLNSMFNYH
jgi:hypothetical protein